MMAIAALAVVFPRADAMMSLHTRLLGLLVSYRTNEVNLAASLVAFVLTQMVVFSMDLSPKLKATIFSLVSALSAVFLLKGLPLLLLWLSAALIKLLYLRRWSLFFFDAHSGGASVRCGNWCASLCAFRDNPGGLRDTLGMV